jgi:ABC-type phosphate/phosphonate transport system substrate-binding protein
MRKGFLLALSAVVVFTVSIGCASDNASTQSSDPSENRSQQFPNWPASLDEFRFHWTADPNIDIIAGAAVPIRAYLESYYVASFSANLDKSIPDS